MTPIFHQDGRIHVRTEDVKAHILFDQGYADASKSVVRVTVPKQFMTPADLREAAEAFLAMADTLEILTAQAAFIESMQEAVQ